MAIERYTPNFHGSIEIEHRHRYAIAHDLANDKVVLDIACGEGYGTYYLSDIAKYVIGIDISQDAVYQANRKYKQNNVKFMTGDATNIPIANSSVDLAVSFETIEHHDKHDEMLAELRRVLKSNGILIISTPNKAKSSGKNPYHIKELFKDEFYTLLNNNFDNILILNQIANNNIGIITPDRSESFISFLFDQYTLQRNNGLVDVTYFIGLASNDNLSDMPTSIFIKNKDISDILYDAHNLPLDIKYYGIKSQSQGDYKNALIAYMKAAKLNPFIFCNRQNLKDLAALSAGLLGLRRKQDNRQDRI